MWQPMETCPEGRPVFVKIDSGDDENQIAIRIRRGEELFCDNGLFCGRAKFYLGWLPCLSWQTGPAPRTGEWILVTWDGTQRCKVRWSTERNEWLEKSGAYVREDWIAWTWDFPDFVQPTPSEPPNDLSGKSVDEIIGEIKRLTDHLATVLRSE